MQLKVGDIVEGKVVSVKEYGAFVEMGADCSGMVHISEIAKDFVDDINNFVKVGDSVKVKVLTIADDGKISLSIKKAYSDNSDKKPFSKNDNKRSSFKPDNSYSWAPKKTAEPTSFEEMMNRFKATSDEKFSDIKRKNSEVRRPRRGSNSR